MADFQLTRFAIDARDGEGTDQGSLAALANWIRDWPGYREQKQFALEQARFEWVLNVDADERVSPELRIEILRELADGAEGIDGFYLPRLVHYLGRMSLSKALEFVQQRYLQ